MIVECKDDQMVLRAESPLESYYFKHFFSSEMAIIKKDEDVLGMDVNCIRIEPLKRTSNQLKN